MAHLHSIYDSDAHFCIDPVTRRIKEDTSLKTLLAQGDHNSERFTFELPRIVEGHDMSLCDKVEIHYLNGTNPGVYEVDDLQISPQSEDVVIFSWLISNNATQLAATLAFAIKLACTTDGVVDYAYNTLPYEKVTVGKSINNGEVIIQEYADILAQWKQELSDAATNVEIDATLTVSGKAADAKATGDAIHSLSEEMLTDDELSNAVATALEQAKASGEFDGAQGDPGTDGITPTIGDNGNWYLGDTDTGKPSRGEAGQAGADGAPGADGKSAYQYAQDGGYTGTEADFAAKLAQEVPTALPNPNALTFTGAVTGSYDGSEPLTVNISSGGGGSGGAVSWKLIRTINIVSGTSSYSFNTDNNENAFKVKNFLILIDKYPSDGYLEIKPNGNFSFIQKPSVKKNYPFSFMMKRATDGRYILETSTTSQLTFERKISVEYASFGEFTSFSFWFSVTPNSDTTMYILGEDV